VQHGKGGGSVFWDADRGCYVGQLSHYDAASSRKRPKVYGASKTECWDKLDALRAETGTVVPRDLTVAELLAHPPGRLEVAARDYQPHELRRQDHRQPGQGGGSPAERDASRAVLGTSTSRLACCASGNASRPSLILPQASACSSWRS
jgi:hypothetical protein